jgi:hypothetical protein
VAYQAGEAEAEKLKRDVWSNGLKSYHRRLYCRIYVTLIKQYFYLNENDYKSEAITCVIVHIVVANIL